MTQHDGFRNTYTLFKDGIKVILGPSKVNNVPIPCKGKGNNLLSSGEICRDVHGFEETYSLFVLEENEEVFDVPELVQPILHEFSDIVPAEILHWLPPMRDIQHCIDFVLGASYFLTNKPIE